VSGVRAFERGRDDRTHEFGLRRVSLGRCLLEEVVEDGKMENLILEAICHHMTTRILSGFRWDLHLPTIRPSSRFRKRYAELSNLGKV
jgi:hypothetical protein